MRTPRIAILVLFLASTLFVLHRALVARRSNAVAAYPHATRPSKSVFGFMYYNTPFSLFPPNAAISLTDDNSTSFAARPAAFGPKLASRGLSGQLWVGSGFGEDSLDTDGELGCSDLPGWGNPNTRAALKSSFKVAATGPSSVKSKMAEKGGGLLDPDNRDAIAKSKAQPSKAKKNDNTDNYLAEGMSGSLSRRDASGGSSAHADIQSIQEAAEIEGKVVLLKRGGCGFLDKVMWAQRRGAVAVIVGDDQKGGPLIQMFARGDEVDNVTVPSVFTARTTAQLLSSLTQPGSFIEDTIDDNGKMVLKVQPSATAKHKKRSARPGTTGSNPATATKVKRVTSPKAKRPRSNASKTGERSEGKGTLARNVHSDSRPPNSGRLDWVLVEDFNDEKDKMISDTLGKSKQPKPKDGDEFVIGVHDWRDPDLVGKSGQKDEASGAESPKTGNPGSKQHSLISKLFGGGQPDSAPDPMVVPADDVENLSEPSSSSSKLPPHQGLWVTITPTSSASPFFDTLLVLVISPLVTLTVIYALLILRAKIRRRRWRAPKSVVDQLPVRTYHTLAPSPACLSPALPSPTPPTPTTPLLQHTHPRSRPRSRTTTGVMESANFHVPSNTAMTPSESSRTARRAEFEKNAGGFSAEWRKYMGRQVECVVCLEEYLDGVSRVMRLPCGHEFHADCM